MAMRSITPRYREVRIRIGRDKEEVWNVMTRFIEYDFNRF